MARLTRSPGAPSPGMLPPSSVQQSLSPCRQPSGSGLQSPPDTEGPGPTQHLRTALFGATHPHASFDNGQHSGATVQRQIMQQLQADRRNQPAVSSIDGSGAQHAAAQHQRGDSTQAYAQREEPVWHNARPWSASSPQGNLAQGFSLHTNPLAEPISEPSFSAIARQHAGSPWGANVHSHNAGLSDADHGVPLSLAELAAIDPNSL